MKKWNIFYAAVLVGIIMSGCAANSTELMSKARMLADQGDLAQAEESLNQALERNITEERMIEIKKQRMDVRQRRGNVAGANADRSEVEAFEKKKRERAEKITLIEQRLRDQGMTKCGIFDLSFCAANVVDGDGDFTMSINGSTTVIDNDGNIKYKY